MSQLGTKVRKSCPLSFRKIYWELEVQLHYFIAQAPDGSGQSDSPGAVPWVLTEQQAVSCPS
jgi:hypothetical protein